MQPQARIVQIFAVTFAVVILLLGLSIQSAFATSSPNSHFLVATLIPGQQTCEADGGSWAGPDMLTGTCTYGRAPGFGANGDSSADEDNSNPVTLHLNGGKNGYATFGAGACDPQCTVSPNLPTPGKLTLPSNALATLYVRLPDGSNAPYTVCFNNPDGKQLLIYRFVSGGWVAVTFGSGSDPLCTSASGDGAFYLGANSSGAGGSYQDQINITIDF
jgi:hypothetical protein